MLSTNNQEESTLKLAQIRCMIANNRNITDKSLDVILQDLNLDLKASEISYSPETVKELIGDSLLHLAYKYLNISAYDVLIRKGADFNAKNVNGNTVLHEIFNSFYISFGHNKWNMKEEESCSINKRIPFIKSTLSAHIEYKNTNNPSDSNGLTHFHIACATNNVEAVDFFLKNGVSANLAVTKTISKKYFEGCTGLHFAAQFGYIEVIQILFKHGASASLTDVKSRGALHVAFERHIAMFDHPKQTHLSKDIAANKRVFNLLHLSFLNEISSELAVDDSLDELEYNPNECLKIESPYWPGYTTLHFSAHINVHLVKDLVNHGGNIEAKDDNGDTPFDLCVQRYNAEDIADVILIIPMWKDIVLSDGKTKLIDLLCAFKDLSGVGIFLEKSSQNLKLFVPLDSSLWPGFTLLHIAVLLSERIKCESDYKENVLLSKKSFQVFDPNLSIITEILKQNADVTTKDNRGCTPVHLAFQLGKTETLKLLLKYHHKAKNFVNDDNLSHLHIACAVENQDLVEKLLWNDVDVNVAYEGDSPISCVYPGWTPLHIAVYKQNCEITELLLKFGANVHAIDKHGFTPIHGLSPFSKELGETLFGTSNLRDCVVEDLGLSYLHVACLNLNVDAVERLLDLGADVNKAIICKMEDGKNSNSMFRAKTHDGWTPLHCALKYSHMTEFSIASSRLEIVNFLVCYGADLLLKNSRNISPLDQIFDYGSNELFSFVLMILKKSDELRKRVQIKTGITALHVACRKVTVEPIKKLLDDGFDVNARIHDDLSMWSGCTPLHVLILGYNDVVANNSQLYGKFDETVKLLLDRGADVTLLNSKKVTPLHLAYHKLYAESDDSSLTQVKSMLKAQKKFEVNPTSIEGISHFHIACHMLDVDVVEKFLEHDVDVNSKIDVFCNFYNAACTPLLLAARANRWSQIDDLSLDESFDKLKIVDLLIKHGARVNVDDLEGNTAVHYAAINSSPRDNLLQRLSRSGADVNAINLRGETPLELILKKKDLRLEEIRYFIACGCRFNAFNSVTEEGYIALAHSRLSHEDVQSLIFGTFVNSSNLIVADPMNRTTIHNLVSISVLKTYVTQYAELFDLSTKFGCDVDDKDSSGRTALHLAAQFRNEAAVSALFLLGADVNVTDNDGKTPFAYVFEPCSRCLDEYHDYRDHFPLFKLFVTQIRKLQLCNLDLHESNEHLLGETFKKFIANRFQDRHDHFLLEIAKLSELKIEPYALFVTDFISDALAYTEHPITSEAIAVIDYPTMSRDKRKAVDEYSRTNERRFRKEFLEAAGIIRLQYRQAVLRRKIIDVAKDSLSELTKFRLPDTCSRIILRLLRNSELQNVILSAV